MSIFQLSRSECTECLLHLWIKLALRDRCNKYAVYEGLHETRIREADSSVQDCARAYICRITQFFGGDAPEGNTRSHPEHDG